ncbi:type II and III secretion system protein [Marinomonas balearica]|uniref:Protein transport protein HofQ/type IV pilus assembly protein PilQ n=1 Tax=Marinomonas balearica TaxID=491947 RepID=A0A4R6M2S6_9GAMM|nr:type II and III secretion system protein [Marinomonas balearica]TDO95561.1 protein transport protein HofQ/type IV pilus assembly protein PilQ [Marinomonas balearica]
MLQRIIVVTLMSVLAMSSSARAMDVMIDRQPVNLILPEIATQMNESIVIHPDIEGMLSFSIQNASWFSVVSAAAQQLGVDLVWQDNIALLMPKIEEQQDKSSIVEPKIDCVPRHWTLKHARAEDVGKQITPFFPKTKLIVDKRTNSIAAKYCSDDGVFEQTLKWLDAPVRQIEIQAHIAQVSRSAQKTLGVNWQSVVEEGSKQALTGVVNLSSIGATSNLTMEASNGGSRLSLLLDALETDGYANVISKPKIVTAEGQSAKIESGTEIPYQVQHDDTTTVEFRQAGLMLEVTPIVKELGVLRLDLKIHQDSVGEMVNGVPSLETNRLNTQVEVKNGETLVLGGIFRQERFENVSKVPVFGDLPVLGALFRHRSDKTEKVELLVFITPKLLQMTIK